MLGPEENRDLLRRVFRALAPRGRVVIQDYIMDEDGTTPRSGALFAINMLVGTQSGSTYTQKEYAAWLTGAGFTQVRRISLAGPSDLMAGQRPA
jgi:hypothetical protein